MNVNADPNDADRLLAAIGLRDLRYFLACVDCAGISAAGKRLHVAQPTLSHAIRRLERTLGCTLLTRGRGRAPTPTATGERLLRHARRLIAAGEALCEDLTADAGAIAGTLRLGSIQSLNLTLLPPVLARFAAAHPQVALRLETLQGTAMAGAVLRHEVDLAVVAGAPSSALATVEVQHLHRERFVAIARRDDPLARRARIPLRALAERDLALVPATSFTGRVIEEACAAAGFAPRRRLELASGEALRETVRAGLGVTILPAGYLDADDRDLCALDLVDPTPRRSVLMLERPGAHRSRAARAFVDHLVDHARTLSQAGSWQGVTFTRRRAILASAAHRRRV